MRVKFKFATDLYMISPTPSSSPPAVMKRLTSKDWCSTVPFIIQYCFSLKQAFSKITHSACSGFTNKYFKTHHWQIGWTQQTNVLWKTTQIQPFEAQKISRLQYSHMVVILTYPVTMRSWRYKVKVMQPSLSALPKLKSRKSDRQYVIAFSTFT